jgi:hypothetical protein
MCCVLVRNVNYDCEKSKELRMWGVQAMLQQLLAADFLEVTAPVEHRSLDQSPECRCVR